MSQQVVSHTAVATPLAAPAKRRRIFGATDVPRSSWAKGRERLAWLLVLPSVLVVAIVAIYPLIQTFYLSFTNARLGSSQAYTWVGWRNYRRLWNDQIFRDSIRHTIEFTVFSVATETLLGIAIALIINSNFKGRGAVRTAMLIPWAIPTVVSSKMWNWMFQEQYGVINDLLHTRLHILHDKVAWTADQHTVLPAIIAIDVWKTTPFMALLLLAGLQVIPGDVYEAATIDGASKWQQFWHMTLPLLKPALLVALIFRTLDAFRVFDIIYVIRSFDPTTMTIAVYAKQQTVDLQRLGLGSAASVVIFLCIAVLVFFYTRLVKVEEL